MNNNRMLGKSKQARTCKYGCCNEFNDNYHKGFFRKKLRARDKRAWKKESW